MIPTTNSTEVFEEIEEIIEDIVEDIVEEEDPTAPKLSLNSSVHNQGAMLVVSGSNVEANRTVETTIYHPDNTKFGIFKSNTTSNGEFQVLIEIGHTSIRGEYRVESIVELVTISKAFIYTGGNNFDFAEITTIQDDTPAPIEIVVDTPPESTPITTPTTSSSNNTPVVTTSTNWDTFLAELNDTDRLGLIMAVFKLLLS